jgi:Rieske Fe-S protein
MKGKVNFIEVYTDYHAAQLSVASLKAYADRKPGTIICPSHESPFLASDGGRVTECPFAIE